MSKLIAWVMLTGCIYCAINWFFPTFPTIAQWIPALSMGASAGLAAIVVAISILFGKD